MEQVLKRIADYQLLNGYLCSDFGFMQGKIGIALFFLFYARHTKNCWYEEFAIDLLYETCDRLYVNLPVNFYDGFCGIGWSLEFMKKQGFLDDDTDEILADVDRIIMEYDLRRISDTSFETGLRGIVAYVRSRLDSFRRDSSIGSFDCVYLNDLESACRKSNILWYDMSYSVNAIWIKIIDVFSDLDTDDRDWRKGFKIMEQSHG